MKTITQQKPFEEIAHSIERDQRIYIVGCGTCATMCETGGKAQVLEMKDRLEESGKEVTGWMVISTACDSLTADALKEDAEAVERADAILVMACAYGVQTVAQYAERMVYPALNTLLLGHEESPGHYAKICIQCASCILSLTGGICPVARCPKNLFHGPCGGSEGGKCEINPNLPCAWHLIIERLSKLGRLDRLEEIVPPKDWSVSFTGSPAASS